MAHLKQKRIRVMVVEDSMTTLELLLSILDNEEDINVVGTAKNGFEAVQNVKNIAPDIILMDINMPIMNGFEASGKIMEECPTPILLVSASWELSEVKPIVESMQLGVLGVHKKPPSPFDSDFKRLSQEMLEAIRTMSEVKVVKRRFGQNIISESMKIEHNRSYSQIVIGASTGGPPVIHKILSRLPANYAYPIVVAQHMSAEFIENFVRWLDMSVAVKVKEAQDLEEMKAGMVYVAPKGFHILLQKNLIRLEEASLDEIIVPKISKLFASIGEKEAKETLAILLSGMGEDGADAMRTLRDFGAMTVAQNQESSVVYGMAKKAKDLGGVELTLSPEEIGELLVKISKEELRAC